MVPSVATEKIPSDTNGDRSRDPPTGNAVPTPGPTVLLIQQDKVMPLNRMQNVKG
jgi:hypothetical protein